MSHTPEPWNANTSVIGGIDIEAESSVVARTNHGDFNNPDEELSTAYLIAASPRLYQALQDLVALVSEADELEHDYFGCRDADMCALCSAKNLLAELEDKV